MPDAANGGGAGDGVVTHPLLCSLPLLARSTEQISAALKLQGAGEPGRVPQLDAVKLQQRLVEACTQANEVSEAFTCMHASHAMHGTIVSFM